MSTLLVSPISRWERRLKLTVAVRVGPRRLGLGVLEVGMLVALAEEGEGGCAYFGFDVAAEAGGRYAVLVVAFGAVAVTGTGRLTAYVS